MGPITGTYRDLAFELASKIQDQYLRAIVLQLLNSIDWTLYDGKIFDSPETSTWKEDVDIYWENSIAIHSAVANNQLQLTFTPVVGVTQPFDCFQFKRQYDLQYGIRLVLHGKFTLDVSRAADVLGQSFNLVGEFPIQSTWDSNIQAWVAPFYFNVETALTDGTQITCKVKITRGTSEVIWVAGFGSNSATEWTTVSANIEVSRGG